MAVIKKGLAAVEEKIEKAAVKGNIAAVNEKIAAVKEKIAAGKESCKVSDKAFQITFQDYKRKIKYTKNVLTPANKLPDEEAENDPTAEQDG